MNNKNNKSNTYGKIFNSMKSALATLPKELFLNSYSVEEMTVRIKVTYTDLAKMFYASERNMKNTDKNINNYSFGGIQVNTLLFLANQETPKFFNVDDDYKNYVLLIDLNANNYFDLIYNIVQKAINDTAFSFEYEDKDNYPTLYVLYNNRYEIMLMDNCQINNIKTNYIASAIQKLPEEMQCYLALQGVVL